MRGRLALAIDGLRRHASGVAWVARENLHITLKFLGGVEEERLTVVADALAQAAREGVFEVAVRGLGAFPTPARPRVLWAGTADQPAFARLAACVDRAMVALGFAPEEHGFTPHVTLGRVREPRRNPALAAALMPGAALEFGRFQVERVVLMRSDLSPRGARYSETAGIDLATT